LVLFFYSCKEESKTLFTLTDPKETGLDFNNDLPYTEEYNTYTYRNFYNGGGVALGDINNDGLLDIYLTGNIKDNKLFLNKGNWNFEDITSKAGVSCPDVWSTGATFVDINADGLLDLYVCKAGKPGGQNRQNELFINQGNLTFVESAKEYGLDFTGLSIHSAFFDYDKDGDLDCYLLSNSLRSVGGFDLNPNQRYKPDPEGNKLLRNENGKFIDVSQEAGIFSSKIGYGLGITLSDINMDGWTDIFISNDFFERDYLYINNQNGTFTEKGQSYFDAMSMGSMGADASDIDNDLMPDLFVTEMLPQNLERKKTKNIYETWDKYLESTKNSYHHQFSRNVLQKNLNGDKFLEIGRFSGVSATDWSWASLIQDYDNDGLRDLFVSNGIYKDLLDKDYLNYSANTSMIKSKIDNKEKVLTMLVDSLPSTAIKNNMFKNIGNMQFQLVSDEWGLGQATFSNGSAYGDLDNDGDLDLVVNNVNMPSYVYRNNSDTIDAKSIRIKLIGDKPNTAAIGAKVIVKYAGNQSMLENFPSRGFQSSMDPILHFGLSNTNIVDTLFVYWPDGSKTTLQNLKSNKLYVIKQSESTIKGSFSLAKSQILHNQTNAIDFIHKELDINQFARERLLVEMNGMEGPAIAIGDINDDKIDDIYCGGGKNQASLLYLSTEADTYEKITQPFDQDYRSEATKARFFDVDNDGDLDLYVAHGGSNFSNYSPELHDVLYLNDGSGHFIKGPAIAFPEPIYTSDFVFADYNKDGLMDIVVVEKMKTQAFGLPGSVYILTNTGHAKFKVTTPTSLQAVGMMTSAASIDVNKDGWIDIAIAGKWMPIMYILNNKGSFENSKAAEIRETAGLWNVLHAVDIDDDGDLDLLCGNEGENTFYRKNMKMYVKDFDGNGSLEQIICQKEGDLYYPIHDIDEMYSQMPFLKKKFRSYSEMAKADVSSMFGEEALKSSKIFEIVELGSLVLKNNKGVFEKVNLPHEAQYSSIFTFMTQTSKVKGKNIFVGGNHYKVKPQFGRQDASLGWLINVRSEQEKLIFASCKTLDVEGQMRYIGLLKNQVVFGINNESLKMCNSSRYD
jgi:enediyne biosynthesis protein E4